VYGCEVLWDAEDAKRVQELTEQGTGKPCPCKRGKRCPILPKTLAVLMGLASPPGAMVSTGWLAAVLALLSAGLDVAA